MLATVRRPLTLAGLVRGLASVLLRRRLASMPRRQPFVLLRLGLVL